MAYYDYEANKIVHFPAKPAYKEGWLEVDCGCCAGIEWGGEYPRDCNRCAGGGLYYVHIKSGVMAQYPGGPLLGRLPADEVMTL